MSEITCPNCNKAFKVDETGYADIMKQVRDKEFEQEIQERLERAQEAKDNAVKIAKQVNIKPNGAILFVTNDKFLILNIKFNTDIKAMKV